MNARAGGYGLFVPGIDWSGRAGREGGVGELMRRHEAIEAVEREHGRRTATQQSLS